MSVLTPDSRAASVTPLPAALARRAAEWLGRDRRGARFAAGLAAGLLAEAAVEVLRRERGRQFDPRVVDAFLEILDERPWRLL